MYYWTHGWGLGMGRNKKEVKKAMRVALNLPEDLWERAKHAAVEERRPLAHILRDLLNEWLEKRTKRRGVK